jgi:FixJ family two-component response regulator
MWGGKGLKKYAVLCVDDEEKILRALQRDFLYESFDSFFVKNAQEALALLEEKEIAVILADMKMPETNGLKLLQQVRQRWPLTVRVVISGYLSFPQVLASINGANIYQFITKPWGHKEEVVEVVKRAIEHHKELQMEKSLLESLHTKNLVCQNIMKKVNQNLEGLKQGYDLLNDFGREILTGFQNLSWADMQEDLPKELYGNALELYHDVSVLAKPDTVLIEMREIMDKIFYGLETLDGVERVEVDYRHIQNEKVRVKDGLLEYGVTKLVDSMLPGVKKYVKLFFKGMEKNGFENIMLIVSPIHRFEGQAQRVKNSMQPIYQGVLKNICESFGGSFEWVNKGSKYLIHLELKIGG